MITFYKAELRVKVVKAMAHPVRLMVIEFLQGRERSFSEIFKLFQFDKSTISKHLLVLKESGVISSRKTGREMIYKLEVPCAVDFFRCANVIIKDRVNKELQFLSR
ncbi:MAG: metalloregulator ArsR/SmtB family transcription factor [Syntrophobacterales bacterium]|nr:metalloregulator ArsR/SmtB family transcription factor [Syntrophobacterales bacterium]